jgi:hypothetical protein
MGQQAVVARTGLDEESKQTGPEYADIKHFPKRTSECHRIELNR